MRSEKQADSPSDAICGPLSRPLEVGARACSGFARPPGVFLDSLLLSGLCSTPQPCSYCVPEAANDYLTDVEVVEATGRGRKYLQQCGPHWPSKVAVDTGSTV